MPDAEQTFLISNPANGLRLFLSCKPSDAPAAGPRRVVLYVHGATFASALSIAYRFDGRSWRDAVCDAGFDVWGLDFQSFGRSDRYPEMDGSADGHPPLCLAADAAGQLEAAVRFILEHQGLDRVSLISHSWGGMAAGLFAGMHTALVERLVLFAPIARRKPSRYAPHPDAPAWRFVTIEDQWNRFVEDIPVHEPPVLSRRHFEDWARCYLDSDAQSRARSPASVKTPSGPFVEILRAWHDELPFDPGKIEAPVAIIRGAWDGLCDDDDARWLFDALERSPVKRDIKIGRGTHLMHLEAMRLALWKESIAFLQAYDVAAVPL